MKSRERFIFSNLKILLLSLTLSLCFINLCSISIDELNVRQTEKSGEEIKFVKIINNYKDGYYHKIAESNFKYLEGKNVKWKEIAGKKAVFLGKIRKDNTIYWLYQLSNGQFIISEVDNYWDNNKQFSYLNENHFVFISEINSLKKEYLNKYIWLNKVDNFGTEGQKTFLNTSNAWFDKFDRVEIIEIQTFYNSGNGNIWFLVENQAGEKAKVKFDKHYKINQIFEFNYYIEDPLNELWGKDIINLIKNHKIKIGMSEYQVMISWGKPNKINRASYGDQWVYENQYLYFENGKLKSFN